MPGSVGGTEGPAYTKALGSWQRGGGGRTTPSLQASCVNKVLLEHHPACLAVCLWSLSLGCGRHTSSLCP